jgi:hypothetical protein
VAHARELDASRGAEALGIAFDDGLARLNQLATLRRRIDSNYVEALARQTHDPK